MKKYYAIAIMILISLNINALYAGNNYYITHTGNAKGININGSEELKLTAASGGSIINVKFKRTERKSYNIKHNKQTINGFSFTYSSTPSSTNTTSDSYGNTTTEATFSASTSTYRSMTATYTGETEVNIPAFKPSDSYPLNTSGLPSSITQYLNATSEIQSSNSTIISKAQSIVSSCTTMDEAVIKIAQWVRGNITYHSASGYSQDALNVYNNKKGNCSGFTNLTIAFLRSIGIPSRYCSAILLNKQYSMPIWSGNTITPGGNGPGTHALYQVYYPSISNWASGDAQGRVNYIDTNNIIRGYGRDTKDCPESVSYSYSGSKPTFSSSITTTIGQINPCNYTYDKYVYFTGTNTTEVLLGIKEASTTGFEDGLSITDCPENLNQSSNYTVEISIYDYAPYGNISPENCSLEASTINGPTLLAETNSFNLTNLQYYQDFRLLVYECSITVPNLGSWNNGWIRDQTNDNYIGGTVHVQADDDINSDFTDIKIYAPLTEISGDINGNYSIGDCKIVGNTYVKNNAILTINPGSELYLRPNVKIKVESGGKIIANGSAANTIKFIRANPNAKWDQIELIGNNNSFNYCLFDGGTWNVHVSYGTGNSFEYCTFSNGVRGFYSSGNVNKFVLDHCLIKGNTDIGAYLTQCWGSMENCEISGNGGPGLRLLAGKLGYYDPGYFTNNYIHSNSGYGVAVKGSLYNGYSSTPGHNLIINNRDEEIRIENYFGSNYYQSNNGGLSDIYDEEFGYYVYNLKPYTMDFEHNFWGSSSGPSGGFYGSVDWDPYEQSSQSNAQNNNPGAGLNKSVNSSNPALEELILQLITEIKQDEYNLKTAYKLLNLYSLTEHPDIKITQKNDIFSLINEKSEKYKKYKEKPDKYTDLSEDDKISLQLTGEIAMLSEVDMLINVEQFDNALIKTNDVDKYITKTEHRHELLDLEVRILQNQKEFKKAYQTLQKLKKHIECEKLIDYNMSDYELWEQDLLYQMGYDPYLMKQLPNIHDDSDSYSIPSNFTLEQNYPNPFNPSTTISFTLPEATFVVLKIFNIKGEEIVTLLDQERIAGNHQVLLKAQNMPSGIYFYQIKAGSFIKTRKMMLMK